jgi:hypothetical protein
MVHIQPVSAQPKAVGPNPVVETHGAAAGKKKGGK